MVYTNTQNRNFGITTNVYNTTINTHYNKTEDNEVKRENAIKRIRSFHEKQKQETWTYTDEREGFIIEALEDIKRGEQVYDSYGRKCNSRFFLNYGFINMNNDANEVPIRVFYNKDD